jgi:hypothetical protein
MAFSSGAAPVLADAMIYAVPTKNLIASDSLIFHRGRNDKERVIRQYSSTSKSLNQNRIAQHRVEFFVAIRRRSFSFQVTNLPAISVIACSEAFWDIKGERSKWPTQIEEVPQSIGIDASPLSDPAFVSMMQSTDFRDLNDLAGL